MQELKVSDYLGIAGFALGVFNASYSVYKTYAENIRRKGDNEIRLLDQHNNRAADLQYFERLKRSSTTRWGYAKVFKNLPPEAYDEADVRRRRLTQFWKEVCSKHQAGELPKGCLAPGSDWHMKARYYTQLMEPIDIANYSRLNFNATSGPYNQPRAGEQPNRPSQYAYLEEATGEGNFLVEHFDKIWQELST